MKAEGTEEVVARGIRFGAGAEDWARSCAPLKLPSLPLASTTIPGLKLEPFTAQQRKEMRIKA